MTNRNGFGITEVLISTAIVGLLGLVAAQMFTSLVRTNTQTASLQSVSEVRMAIVRNLEKQDSFLAMLSDPRNSGPFSCIVNSTDCRGVANSEFLILEKNSGSGAVTVNDYVSLSSEPTKGFDRNGRICNQFDATAGSDACPFKYVAKWTAYCPTPQNIKGLTSVETMCRNPLLDISVDLIVRPKTPNAIGALNVSKMKIRLTKSQVETDARKICQMLGPTAVLVGNTCVVPSATNVSCIGACGPNVQALVKGFGVNGEPLCSCEVAPAATGVNLGQANRGRVLLGIRPDGSLISGDGIIPALISSGAINNPPVSFSGDGGDGGGGGGGGGGGS